MFEGVFALRFVAEQVGFYVWQDCLFAEVVTDDGGDVGVDGLVVGDARADGVGQGDVTGAIGIQEAGYAQGRAALEGERVKVVVVDAPVDHVDALQTTRRAHIDDVIMHDQVAPLNQFDAHLASEVGVLKIGGIVDARGEQRDYRLCPPSRGEREQRVEQRLPIVIDGADTVAAKERWEGAFHDAAVRQHVGDAAWHAQIIL